MKRSITQEDVDGLVKDGVVFVTRDMVLTPSAREYASRRGYRIEFERGVRQASPRLNEEEIIRLVEQAVAEELEKNTNRVSEQIRDSMEQTSDNHSKHSEAAGIFSTAAASGRAIVASVGLNRPGIVAALSNVVAECGGDLEDVRQVIVGKYFSLIFVVNIEQLKSKGISFREFKERLKTEGQKKGGMEVLVMHEDIFKAMHKV